MKKNKSKKKIQKNKSKKKYRKTTTERQYCDRGLAAKPPRSPVPTKLRNHRKRRVAHRGA